jgi:hypothetical protein
MMSKIDKITKVFTKTISALVKEGDKLTLEANTLANEALLADIKSTEARVESKRAYKIAAKLEGVLN